ncbi:MAG TPA: BamA/TamA family outer membrane protein, partial [Longimicrobiales bacterium]|nr:BamA/TamA family outer membrane protein [Longimicrobiales bacterium]
MTPTIRRLRGVVAATLALLGAGAVALGAQEVPPPGQGDIGPYEGAEVVDVRFEGSRQLPPAQLASAIRTRETTCTLVRLACWFGIGVEEDYVDSAVLAADELRLRLFYYERGFRNAQVLSRVEAVEDGVNVVFVVDEGEPVRVVSISYAGEAERVAPILKPRTPLGVGEPLDLLALQESRDTLQARLRDRGYARAEVLAGYLIPTDSPFVARVTYDVFPGEPARFGEIRVVGAEAVSPAIVRRMLTFSAGDVYRASALVASQRQLYALEIFTHASIETHPDELSGDSIPVTVSVNEGDVHRVRLGVGVNSLDCVNAEGRWISRSFLGGARRLEVRGRVSNLLSEELRMEDLKDLPCSEAGTGPNFGTLNGSLNVDFVQPWFLGPRNALGTGLGFERRSVPGVFVRDSRGGYVSLTRRLGGRTSVSIAYRPALTSFLEGDDPFFCVSFLACDEASVELLREPNWLAPLALALVHDGSNSIFSPTAGYVLRLDGEVASNLTGSAFQYVRLTGEVASYVSLPADLVLATHVRPGWAQSIAAVAGDRDLGLHPQRRFFAGGPNSVRGFAQSRLGPKILAVNGTVLADSLDIEVGGEPMRVPGCPASTINDGTCDAQPLDPGLFEPRPTGGTVLLEGNLELRFPIVGPLRGVAFLDAGQVWNDELNLRELAWSPGLGFRYYSPIGPIRVDVGYNTSGAERLPVRATGVCVLTPDGPDPGDEPDDCVDPDPGVYYDPELLGNTNELRSLDPVTWEPRGEWYDLDRFQ